MLDRLKGWLRPLRPVLLPVWRRIRPTIDRASRLPSPSTVVAARKARERRRAEADRGEIRPITKAEFDWVARRYPYYRNRWAYTSAAGREAADLISRHHLRTAIELGAHIRPLIVGADAMVLAPSVDRDLEGRVVVQDARRTPWAIPDGAYDLFVGPAGVRAPRRPPGRGVSGGLPRGPSRRHLAPDRLGDGRPDQLPPRDHPRAGARLVCSTRPDPGIRRQRGSAAAGSLRLRGSRPRAGVIGW